MTKRLEIKLTTPQARVLLDVVEAVIDDYENRLGIDTARVSRSMLLRIADAIAQALHKDDACRH